MTKNNDMTNNFDVFLIVSISMLPHKNIIKTFLILIYFFAFFLSNKKPFSLAKKTI